MAAGILGKADLAAGTITSIYTVPASKLTSFSILLCNKNSQSTAINIALSASSSVQAASEFIEYNTTIPAYGVYERTGLILDAAKFVTISSSLANVNVLVLGFEEAA